MLDYLDSLYKALLLLTDAILLMVAWIICFIFFLIAGMAVMTGGLYYLPGIFITALSIILMIVLSGISNKYMG